MDYFKNSVVKALAGPLKGKMKEEEIKALIERPPERKMGDYALPCFKLAPIMRLKPTEIAVSLQKTMKLPKSIDESRVVGSYLNFFVNKEMFAQKVLEQVLKEDEKFASSNEGKGKKIIVEFCQANTHKAFHIGYIRNLSIGETLSRLFEKKGYKVIRANFQGDVGPHIAKCLWAYENFYKGKEKEIKYNKGKWLGEIYTDANKRIDNSPEKEILEQKMRDTVYEMYENSNPKLMKLWKKTRKWSLDYFDSIYRQLGIKFDRLYFESETEKPGLEIVKQIKETGLIEESDGALIIDLEKYNLQKFLLLKSDGMPLYSTKDLGLAKMKKQEYNPVISYNVVADEQNFYFTQLIKTIEIFSEKWKPIFVKTQHVSYGLLNLKEGKMSSRAGTVVLYDDLFERMYVQTYKETKKRHSDWNEKKISKTAEQIALAAIKFAMLNRDNAKTIVFDWKYSLKFEGETGPYLLYTYARARSILRKAKEKNFKKADFSQLQSEPEQKIISLIAGFESAVNLTLDSKSPHNLCQYLLELSSAFNSFYHSTQVINSEKSLRIARLGLVSGVSIILKIGLSLLNIGLPEEM